MSDGVFTSTGQVISLVINPVNDIPTVVADSATGTEDTILLLTGLLSNDIDSDVGDTLTLGSIVAQGTKGTAVLSGSTDITYTPIADVCGTDIFTYTIQDQSGTISSPGNVSVTLNCTNDAPLAIGSSFTTT